MYLACSAPSFDSRRPRYKARVLADLGVAPSVGGVVGVTVRKEAMKKSTQACQTADAELFPVLKARFDAHPERHPGVSWELAAARLQASPAALAALAAMEASGGEPDCIGRDGGPLLFVDCAQESPAGRRSLCYDRAARLGRKNAAPPSSAMEEAEGMGAELLDETLYSRLQGAGEFDLKTSSWLLTPPEIRERGGALFGDRRYGRVFTYHNGADSYYGARGFRTFVRV